MTFQQLHLQSETCPSTVEVVLENGPERRFLGIVLRDDATAAPDRMVIMLENGWTVYGAECAEVRPIGNTDLRGLLPRELNDLFTFLRMQRQKDEPARGFRVPSLSDFVPMGPAAGRSGGE